MILPSEAQTIVIPATTSEMVPELTPEEEDLFFDLLDLNEEGLKDEEVLKRKTKIFVGGLKFSSEDDVLQDYFSKFGEIKEAVVIRDRKTGLSKGYGFVTMAEFKSAIAAINDKSPKLDGRRCNVNLAYIGQKKNGFSPTKKNGFFYHNSPQFSPQFLNAYGLPVPSQAIMGPGGQIMYQYPVPGMGPNGEQIFIENLHPELMQPMYPNSPMMIQQPHILFNNQVLYNGQMSPEFDRQMDFNNNNVMPVTMATIAPMMHSSMSNSPSPELPMVNGAGQPINMINGNAMMNGGPPMVSINNNMMVNGGQPVILTPNPSSPGMVNGMTNGQVVQQQQTQPQQPQHNGTAIMATSQTQPIVNGSPQPILNGSPQPMMTTGSPQPIVNGGSPQPIAMTVSPASSSQPMVIESSKPIDLNNNNVQPVSSVPVQITNGHVPQVATNGHISPSANSQQQMTPTQQQPAQQQIPSAIPNNVNVNGHVFANVAHLMNTTNGQVMPPMPNGTNMFTNGTHVLPMSHHQPPISHQQQPLLNGGHQVYSNGQIVTSTTYVHSPIPSSPAMANQKHIFQLQAHPGPRMMTTR